MAQGDSAMTTNGALEPPACPTIYGCVQDEPDLGIRGQHSIWCPRHDPKTCPTCHAIHEQTPPVMDEAMSTTRRADVPFSAWSPSWRARPAFTNSAV
jgi:hypothetical protein